MNASNRLPAVFIADAIALDFLNTATVDADVPYEWLSDGEALLSWLEQADLMPAEVLGAFRLSAVASELSDVAHQARVLREWFRAFVRRHKGEALSSEVLVELETINRILERDARFGQIVVAEDSYSDLHSGELAKASMRKWDVADTLLIPIAEAIANCVVTEDFTRVKACHGHKCSMIFIDRAHKGDRRWCSMTTCGNRAKQAKHRRRRKAALGEP